MTTLQEAIDRLEENCTDNKLAAHAHGDCLKIVHSLAKQVEQLREAIFAWKEASFSGYGRLVPPDETERHLLAALSQTGLTQPVEGE